MTIEHTEISVLFKPKILIKKYVKLTFTVYQKYRLIKKKIFLFVCFPCIYHVVDLLFYPEHAMCL